MLSSQTFNHFLSHLESRSFQIEVLTSGHEEITVVRLSPKAVQQAVDETFRNNIKVSSGNLSLCAFTNECIFKEIYRLVVDTPTFSI